jgi:hypothetical protein
VPGGGHPRRSGVRDQAAAGRVLGEFGDPHRYASAKSRKNYGGTSPIIRAPGKRKIVGARFVHNDRVPLEY